MLSPRSAAAAMSREPEIMESQVMWEPDTKRNTHMDRFRAAVASSCGLRLGERWAGAVRGRGGLTVGPIRVPLGSRCRWAPPGAGGAAGGMLCLSPGQRPPGQHPPLWRCARMGKANSLICPCPCGWMSARAALPAEPPGEGSPGVTWCFKGMWKEGSLSPWLRSV